MFTEEAFFAKKLTASWLCNSMLSQGGYHSGPGTVREGDELARRPVCLELSDPGGEREKEVERCLRVGSSGVDDG